MTAALRSSVGVVTTHPIQYQAPWFRLLAAEPDIDLTVYFAMIPDARQQGDGFGIEFQWDLPLREGYRSEVLENRARNPSVTRFGGCDTPGIGRVVRSRRWDAFIVNGWVVRSCLQALFACRRSAVPCLVRGESNVLRRRGPLRHVLHRLLLSQYAGCLAIGRLNREFYRANGVPESRIFWTPYSVDNVRFAAAAERARAGTAALRRLWGIPDGVCVFLFCGKLVPKKRPLDFLRAGALMTARSAADRPPIYLLVAGDGAMRAACETFARERGLPATFTGFLNQTQVPEAYAAADVLVLPSDDGETWGLVVNEAMACGLPALVSDRVGCHPDLVLPGETGDVFGLGDVEGLAAVMAVAAADPERRARMGREARLRVAKYSYEEAVRGTRDALERVSGRRRS